MSAVQGPVDFAVAFLELLLFTVWKQPWIIVVALAIIGL